MPRLIDDIRGAGRLGMPWFVPRHKEQVWEQHAVRVIELLQDPALPVLVIDNVAEYFYTGTDQEQWNIDRDFPNLAPPFPMFWAEHKMVRTIHSKECGDTDVTRILPQGGRVGQLFVAAERDQVKGEDIPENAHWILWCELFVDYRKPGVTADGPHGSVFLCIDSEGRIVGNPSMQSFASAENNEQMKQLMAWFNPSLLAISFLHCKNVTIIDNPVPPKLARRYRERHGGARLTGFKTLVIEPLKQILRTQGRSGEHGLAKALHICRGHFRDYRQGAGLFGKYHQLVWTPATVRGTKGKGAPPPREIEVKV
jgi:hypothetical protein